MQNDTTRVDILFQKYLNNLLDEAERQEFLDYVEDPIFQPQLNALLSLAFDNQTELTDVNAEERQILIDKILSKEQAVKTDVSTKKLWPRIRIAAAVVLVMISAGIWLYSKNQENLLQDSDAYANDIAPGKNGATLTLANGKKILINDALAGNIASESGVKISKNADGQLIYEITNDNLGEIAYNTLSTTRGEQTQVRLPDGTLVFLNAESSLKYPTSFAGAKKRQVELIGEGYFEVAKDKAHPFIVKGEKQDVEVLGTHFNIESYPTSAQIKTTLLEGSVKVSSKTGITRILKPNQQLVLSTQHAEVKEIEAEYEIAWKEGFFMFNNESLESIMEQVALWYNVEVVYEDASLKKETYVGTVNRFDKVSKVLSVLKKTDVAEFKIEQNKIIVSRKNK